MNVPQRKSHWLRWCIIGYVALAGAVVAAMIWARQSAVSQSSSLTSNVGWNEWRESERERQSQHGPVERRVPMSEEPPALVLMRDYFAVLMFGAHVVQLVALLGYRLVHFGEHQERMKVPRRWTSGVRSPISII